MKTIKGLMAVIVEDGQAQPTSRCLPSHQAGCQEWMDYGTLPDGTRVKIYWIFEADEADVELSEDLPWDEAHVDRIVDEDGNILAQ